MIRGDPHTPFENYNAIRTRAVGGWGSFGRLAACPFWRRMPECFQNGVLLLLPLLRHHRTQPLTNNNDAVEKELLLSDIAHALETGPCNLAETVCCQRALIVPQHFVLQQTKSNNVEQGWSEEGFFGVWHAIPCSGAPAIYM